MGLHHAYHPPSRAVIGLAVPGRPIRSLVAEDRSAKRRPQPDGTGRRCRAVCNGLPTRQVVALDGPRPSPEFSDGRQGEQV
jgi:hypothetical protein